MGKLHRGVHHGDIQDKTHLDGILHPGIDEKIHPGDIHLDRARLGGICHQAIDANRLPEDDPFHLGGMFLRDGMTHHRSTVGCLLLLNVIRPSGDDLHLGAITPHLRDAGNVTADRRSLRNEERRPGAVVIPTVRHRLHH